MASSATSATSTAGVKVCRAALNGPGLVGDSELTSFKDPVFPSSLHGCYDHGIETVHWINIYIVQHPSRRDTKRTHRLMSTSKSLRVFFLLTDEALNPQRTKHSDVGYAISLR